eukprot:334063_1
MANLLDELIKIFEIDLQNIDCDGECIQNCNHLKRLTNTMMIYNRYNSNLKQMATDEIIAMNVLHTLDDYLHLIHNHDNDDEFVFIFKTLGNCTVTNCSGIRGNYRNRDKYGKTKQKTNWSLEILDKIHCYFVHSYQIGYRLTMNEKNNIYGDIDEKSTDTNFVNNNMLKLKNILSQKRETLKSITASQTLQQRANNKCEQVNAVNHKVFHFGHSFEYGYKNENKNVRNLNDVKVSEKYKSLKEELINNKMATVNIDQFNNEYQKAMIHFNSVFCKAALPTFIERDKVRHTETIWILSIEYILSLMIYCNYTNLQYEFSKTYRTIDKYNSEHHEYYHLGKNLKIIVQKFGTQIVDGNIKRFYHGISEILQFQNTMDAHNAIRIFCPLSTTSSFEVATLFATRDNGMIFEFTGASKYHYQTKYFSVAWLSDFPGEKEYFFIQNGRKGHLQIVNILDIQTGYEYELILDALKAINKITNKPEKNAKAICIERKLEELILCIIHHQLSLTNATYKPFESLNKYAKTLISRYVIQRKNVRLNWSVMTQLNCDILMGEFWCLKLKWIKLKNIVAFFPNVQYINIVKKELNDQILEGILNVLSANSFTSNIKKIEIADLQTTHPLMIVNKYKGLFTDIGYHLNGSADSVTYSKNKFVSITKNEI